MSAFSNSLTSLWREPGGILPPGVRNRLLTGSVGGPHLLRLASDTLAAATQNSLDPELFALGRDFFLAAWEEDPLSGHLYPQLLAMHNRSPWLDTGLVRLLAALGGKWSQPENLAYYERLAAQLDFAKIHRYLDTQAAKEPENLYWTQQTLLVAELDGDIPWARDRVKTNPHAKDPVLAPLFRYFLANLFFQEQEYHKAALLYEDISKTTPGWLKPLERLAACRYRLGERDTSLGLMAQVLAARPWHVNLLLHLHDLALGLDQAPSKAPDNTVALIYSFNKAPDLDTTLESLAQSAGWDRVVALDNGSTDNTGSVLNKWADTLGGRMERIDLPVNVGAPAARNWLMHLESVARSDFAVYLDDDVILPPDWLERFGAAVDTYPEAAVWGCRVMDAYVGHTIQSADLHLTPGGDGSDPNLEQFRAENSLDRVDGAMFRISGLHSLNPDYGLFQYLRPCVSVTGCCHLFRTRELLESGDFSLQLSPSQYDDLEHDLRQANAGRFAAFQGFLSIGHRKRSGKAVNMNRAQLGNGRANLYKLQRMYTPDQALRMFEFQANLLLGDLRKKLARVEECVTQTLNSTE